MLHLLEMPVSSKLLQCGPIQGDPVNPSARKRSTKTGIVVVDNEQKPGREPAEVSSEHHEGLKQATMLSIAIFEWLKGRTEVRNNLQRIRSEIEARCESALLFMTILKVLLIVSLASLAIAILVLAYALS